jgi:hypothetical protein
VRLISCLFAAASILTAADWYSFRAGPLEVWSNGSEKDSREVLALFDQVHWWTAKLLGRTEVVPLWPVRIVVVRRDRSASRYRTGQIERRRNVYTAGMVAGDPVPPKWISDFVRILLKDGTAVMPRSVEQGLLELVATVQVRGTMLTIGTPPADTARRTRDWARMHLLCVPAENSGRVRVYLSNLQQDATMDSAYRNAFGKTEREMEAEVDRYFRAGVFNPEQISGKPISLERDYRPRTIVPERAAIALADSLNGAAAKAAYQAALNQGDRTADAHEGAEMYQEAVNAGSDSAAAWYEYSLTLKDPEKAKEALRKAMELNPRWARPHARFSELMVTEGKIAPAKKACELEPRNIAYWERLAGLQVQFKDFDAALLSWRKAERAGASPEERAKIEEKRRAFEQEKLDLEAAERKRIAEETARDLARVKAEQEKSIREAEAQANAKLGKYEGEKPVEWWNGPKGQNSLEGALERVDCLKGPARLAIRDVKGRLSQYIIRDPASVAITGRGDGSLGCGPQRPARKVRIGYNPNQDARLGTSGDIVEMEFVDAR